MQRTYRFTAEGTGGFRVDGVGTGDNTFKCESNVHCEFHDVFERGMQETFKALTLGKAIYGKPGVGCSGPYQIHRVMIEEVKQ